MLVNSNKHFINDLLTSKDCGLVLFEDQKIFTSSSERRDLENLESEGGFRSSLGHFL